MQLIMSFQPLSLIAARSVRANPETGYTRKVFDTIADNAANAGIITGGRKVDPTEVDLRWCGAIVESKWRHRTNRFSRGSFGTSCKRYLLDRETFCAAWYFIRARPSLTCQARLLHQSK